MNPKDMIINSKRSATLNLNSTIYTEKTIFSAYVPFINNFFISVEKNDDRMIVTLTPKNGVCDLDEISYAFLDSLIASM